MSAPQTLFDKKGFALQKVLRLNIYYYYYYYYYYSQ